MGTPRAPVGGVPRQPCPEPSPSLRPSHVPESSGSWDPQESGAACSGRPGRKRQEQTPREGPPRPALRGGHAHTPGRRREESREHTGNEASPREEQKTQRLGENTVTAPRLFAFLTGKAPRLSLRHPCVTPQTLPDVVGTRAGWRGCGTDTSPDRGQRGQLPGRCRGCRRGAPSAASSSRRCAPVSARASVLQSQEAALSAPSLTVAVFWHAWPPGQVPASLQPLRPGGAPAESPPCTTGLCPIPEGGTPSQAGAGAEVRAPAGGSGRKHCAVSSFVSQRKGESSGPGAISGLTPAPTAGPPWPWCPDRKFKGIVTHLWRPPSSLPQMVSGDD